MTDLATAQALHDDAMQQLRDTARRNGISIGISEA
jgi:hypothetical protein